MADVTIVDVSEQEAEQPSEETEIIAPVTFEILPRASSKGDSLHLTATHTSKMDRHVFHCIGFVPNREEISAFLGQKPRLGFIREVAQNIIMIRNHPSSQERNRERLQRERHQQFVHICR